jgi:hypothetical protein
VTAHTSRVQNSPCYKRKNRAKLAGFPLNLQPASAGGAKNRAFGPF